MTDVRMEIIFHVLVDERDDELLMARSSARWLDVGGETTTSAAKDRVFEEKSDEIGNGRRKRFAKLLVEVRTHIVDQRHPTVLGDEESDQLLRVATVDGAVVELEIIDSIRSEH